MLLRPVGLTTRSTANRAWQSIAGALPAGTPAPIEVVTLAVHDYITLKYRDRDAADMAFQAMSAATLAYVSSKGKALTASAIRVKPPAIRRRGVALSPFYKAISDEMPDVDITQKHKTKGRLSASTFLVECAGGDKDDYVPIATVMWQDDGNAIRITEVDIDEAAPPKLAKALRKLSP